MKTVQSNNENEILLSDDPATVLDHFLHLPISTPDPIFSLFRTLPGAIEHSGGEKQRFLYVPGTREDHCVLAAHADTVFDRVYIGKKAEEKPALRDGVYFSESGAYGIGADDRAGCAMLWLLRNSGHSLLVLDGEEFGQIGAKYLRSEFSDLFEELNNHSFMLQLDRRGSNDYKCYHLDVTDEFKSFIENTTGYELSISRGFTDICTLCETVCGVNLSIGYYDEHTPKEKLVYEEWLHTFEVVKSMIGQPLKRYALRTINRKDVS